MSANVEPEEIAAILDGVADEVRAAARVEARDFRRPQRFSVARLAALEALLRKPLVALPAALAEGSGARLAFAIGGLGEVSAEGLFDGVEDVTILRFDVGGQPGWLRWDAAEAASLAEAMLGASDAQSGPRPLTRLEQRLVGEPLVTLVGTLAQALGLQADGFGFASSPKEAGSWADAPDGGDAHRLCIDLDVTRAGAEPSTAQLYLPLPPGAGVGGEAPAPALPRHLESVAVEVTCHLAQTEITFSQLLQLEEGDVLSTDVRVDEPARLLLEDRPFARALLGTHRGRFAVRLVPAERAGQNPS